MWTWRGGEGGPFDPGLSPGRARAKFIFGNWDEDAVIVAGFKVLACAVFQLFLKAWGSKIGETPPFGPGKVCAKCVTVAERRTCSDSQPRAVTVTGVVMKAVWFRGGRVGSGLSVASSQWRWTSPRFLV